jgi:HK97 family phage portal protein
VHPPAGLGLELLHHHQRERNPPTNRKAASIPGFLNRLGRGLATAARRAMDLIPGQSYGYSLISPVLSGIVVTPQTALTLAAWFSGVNVISTDVAKLPLGLCQALEGGGQIYARGDRRHRIVARKPNAEMNAVRYRQMQMGHTLGWGNHYSEIVRDGSGAPLELWPLHPGTTKPMRDDKGKALYYEDTNSGKRWRLEDIVHIAGLSFDGITGYSPTTMGRQAIGLGIAEEQFGAALFGNGARPGGILRTPKRLSTDAAKRLRESFENIHQGTLNAFRTAVLEEGLEWQESQISPELAQFLGSRQFQVIEIARLLNIPPHKLQDYSQAHLTNVEEANLDYITSTLQGWLEQIEAEYDAKLLFEEESDRLFFQHDMNALLRGNMTARSNYYARRFQVGSISPNEIRAREGDNPIPDEPNATKCYLQAQYVPLERAGEALTPAAAAASSSSTSKPAPADPLEELEEQDELTPATGTNGNGNGKRHETEPRETRNSRYRRNR